MVRCNFIGAYINQIAGSNYRSEAHKYLPMSCMICEVCFGKCPSQDEIEDQQGSRDRRDYDHTNMSEDLARAGMNVIRVCVFHMKSHVASRQPGLCHEAYDIMLADCFAFQTDIVAGDANMSGYRYGGSRQGSASIKHSCWQDMVRYFVKAYNNGQNQDPNCRLIPRFVSSNPLSSLRWWEDTFGFKYDRCRLVNWDTVSTLDCIVCCILEWAHSIPMEKWSTQPPGLSTTFRTGVQHFRQPVAFAPVKRRLFVQSVGQGQSHALAGAPKPSLHQADVRAQMRTETKIDSKARRKERQRLNKAQANGATSGTTGSTSTAPPPTRGTTASAAAPPRTTPGRPSSVAPTTPPKASGTAAPVTPPESAPAVNKGKSNAKGKGATSDDAGKVQVEGRLAPREGQGEGHALRQGQMPEVSAAGGEC